VSIDSIEFDQLSRGKEKIKDEEIKQKKKNLMFYFSFVKKKEERERNSP